VTSVQEDVPNAAALGPCLFHNINNNSRLCGICCLSSPQKTPTTSQKRSQQETRNSHLQSKISQRHVVEYLGGMEGANTVITAVDCGPETCRTEKGIMDKAKGLAGKLSRISLQNTRSTPVRRTSGGGNGEGEQVEMKRFTVSYDVSRTVEEKVGTGVKSEISST
jgi:hypothetical protein